MEALPHINGAILQDNLKHTTWPSLVNKQNKTVPPATDGFAKIYKCTEHLLHLEHCYGEDNREYGMLPAF